MEEPLKETSHHRAQVQSPRVSYSRCVLLNSGRVGGIDKVGILVLDVLDFDEDIGAGGESRPAVVGGL